MASKPKRRRVGQAGEARGPAGKIRRKARTSSPGANGPQPTRPLDLIKIGDRVRVDMGDIDALVRSIDARGGLLQPIVVTPKDELIAGGRRILAWKRSRFGGEPIPVHVVDIDSIVAGEWDENAPGVRKDFTLSEAVAIKRLLEPRLQEAAKERQRAHGGTAPGKRSGAGAPPMAVGGASARSSGERNGPPQKEPSRPLIPDSAGKHSGQVARSDAPPGRAADQVATVTGKSRRTLEKAQAIVEAAERDPKKFGNLKRDMDRSGRADAPYRRLRVMQQAEEIRKEPPPLPGNGPYRGGIIDPPWPSEPDEDDPKRLARGYYPYPTMAIEKMCELPVASLLHEDAAVGIWITNYHLAQGHHVPVLKAWGLVGATIRTWVKDRMGRGQILRGQTEHLIIAVRGKPVIQLGSMTTFFHAAAKHGGRGAHSEKPQKAYDDFETLIPAPRYFELFSRHDRPNWDGHGDEVGKLTRPIKHSPEAAAAATAELLAETKQRNASPRADQDSAGEGRPGARRSATRSEARAGRAGGGDSKGSAPPASNVDAELALLNVLDAVQRGRCPLLHGDPELVELRARKWLAADDRLTNAGQQRLSEHLRATFQRRDDAKDLRPRFKQEAAAGDGLDIPTFLARGRAAQLAGDDAIEKAGGKRRAAS